MYGPNHIFIFNSRSIHFYKLNIKGLKGYKMVKEHDIKHLSYAPMCLEYINSTLKDKNSYLLWGDTEGYLESIY